MSARRKRTQPSPAGPPAVVGWGGVPEVRRRRLRVAGRVQGVGYRVACAEVAVGLGLGGSVRNLDDGTVEVVAEGPVEALERLAQWCRLGPRGARVDRVTVVEDRPADVGLGARTGRFRIDG